MTRSLPPSIPTVETLHEDVYLGLAAQALYNAQRVALGLDPGTLLVLSVGDRQPYLRAAELAAGWLDDTTRAKADARAVVWIAVGVAAAHEGQETVSSEVVDEIWRDARDNYLGVLLGVGKEQNQ